MSKRINVLLVTGLFVLSLACTAWAAPTSPNFIPPGQAKKMLPVSTASENGEALEQSENGSGVKILQNSIRVRKQEIKFDVPPVIKEGRTLIPIRAITQGLGATVHWDAAASTVTITKNDLTVVLTLGSYEVIVNEETVVLDVPAQLVSNRTFVPLRFLAEIFRQNVTYDEETGDIDIDDVDDENGNEAGDKGEDEDNEQQDDEDDTEISSEDDNDSEEQDE